MQMIGHYNERMQQKPALVTIALKHVKHEVGIAVNLKTSAPARSDSRDEIRADFLWREFHR